MSDEIEVWKDFPNGNGVYQVSTSGFIKNVKLNKIMSINTHRHGYTYSTLTLDGLEKKISIHRAVALTFLPNPENKKCVNHKNGIKSDNRLENLEWTTHSENGLHSYTVLGNKASTHMTGKTGKLSHSAKKVIQRNKETKEIIKIWDCAADIQRELGYLSSSITQCCQGIIKSSHGFIWEFYKKENV